MKCKEKECKGCMHFINIRTHPLFKELIIKSEDGKVIDFEGCVFHLQALFLRQIWIRTWGNQAAIEKRGDHIAKAFNAFTTEIKRAIKLRLELNEKDLLDRGEDNG